MTLKKCTKNNFFYLGFFIFTFFFILNYENYLGNKLIFFIFNLSSFALFFTLLNFRLSAFEFFFYTFLLLSFWFKFSCILYFDKIIVTEGDFELSNNNYDSATIVIIFTFFTCIFASIIKKFYFKRFLNESSLELSKPFINFYTKYRAIILFLYIFSLLLICVINFKFKIYSKGLVNQDIPTYVNFFFSWSFTYGLSIITSLLIYIDFIIFKNKKYFVLGLFETFFSHMTIYSRAFILSIFAYFRGYYYLIEVSKTKISKSLLIKVLIFILIFFLLSFFIINELRYSNFNKKDNLKPLKIETTIFEFVHLSVNRWVGIDGLLSVSQSKNISFDLFFSSLDEKKEIRKKSFYMNNFFKSFKYSENEDKNLNIVITPGLIAFLYYSGSIVFVCISLLLVILTCALIEKLFSYISGKNIILANLIGYALAVRFIHFGYVPYNTINYLLSFFITLLVIYFFTRLISKANHKI
jgi:hypothetical protein